MKEKIIPIGGAEPEEFKQKPASELIELDREIRERNRDITEIISGAMSSALLGRLRGYAQLEIKTNGLTVESFLLPESNIDRLALIGMLQRMVVRLSDIALADVEQRCFQHKEYPKDMDD